MKKNKKKQQNPISEQHQQELKICVTGFDDKNILKENLQKLKIDVDHIHNLYSDTNLIIAKNVFGLKYRSGKLLGIPIVSEKWLNTCLDQNKILDYNEFQLKVFEGVNMALLGFNNKEYEELTKCLFKNGCSNCQLIPISALTNDQGKQVFDVIIVKSKEIKKYQSYMGTFQEIPFVSEQWIKECLFRKQYIMPVVDITNSNIKSFCKQQISSFLIGGYSKLNRDQLLQQENKYMIKKIHELQYQMNNSVEITNKKYQYLANYIIYLYNLNEKLRIAIQLYIALGGGLSLKELFPGVTHIICSQSSLDKLEMDKLKIFDKNVKILTTTWILDCFNFKTNIQEQEYTVIQDDNLPSPRLFQLNKKFQSSLFFSQSFSQDSCSPQQGDKGINFNSQINTQFQLKTYSLSQIEISKFKADEKNNNKIDCQVNSNLIDKKSKIQRLQQLMKTPRKQTPKKRVQPMVKPVKLLSQLFKGKIFCLHFQNANDKYQMRKYQQIIREHNGQIIGQQDIQNYLQQQKDIINIVNDGTNKTLNQCQKGNFLSYRWIDYCIQSNCLIDLNHIKIEKLSYLLPFPYKMPLKDFQGLQISIMGEDNKKSKTVLIELIRLIGGNYIKQCNENLKYILCGDNYYKSSKYKQLLNENYLRSQIILVKSDWILYCIQQGKLKDKRDFEIFVSQ